MIFVVILLSLFTLSLSATSEYPVEGFVIPPIVDLSGCNHRTSLARVIKHLSEDEPDLVDLSHSSSLDIDQLGLMLGSVVMSRNGVSDEARKLAEMAQNEVRPFKGIIKMIAVPFENDYPSVFGSKNIGYQFLMRSIIAMHLFKINEETRSLVFSVFGSFLSVCSNFTKKRTCLEATAAVPVDVRELSKFSHVLDQIIQSAISGTELPSDVETTLQELEANHRSI